MNGARIVVLTVAIGAGGAAAFLAGRSPKPPQIEALKVETVDILIAKSNIDVGQTVTPGELQWQAWPKTASTGNFIRRGDNPQAIEKLSGEIARLPIMAGEPIHEARLIDAKGSGFMAAILPSGMRAVSTQISPETGAGGFILPNDRVDVILTGSTKDQQQSETILTNVRVLAIDQLVHEKDGQKVVIGKTATLELAPELVEKLALAQHLGTLSLALRSITDARHGDAPPSGWRNVKVTIFHDMKRQDYTVPEEPEGVPGNQCTNDDIVCSAPSGGGFSSGALENVKISVPIERDQPQPSSAIVQKPFFLTSDAK
jgi:pilus assembly protein CpaB